MEILVPLMGEATQRESAHGVAIKDGQCSQPIEQAGAAKVASAGQLMRLLEEQGFLCAACGAHLSPATTELDHKTPLASDGNSLIANLQWLCRGCNRAKGSMSMDEFVRMCARVVRAPLSEMDTEVE